ncbi:MAG: hypothetical protein ACOY0S_01470 [Patescibacteria group bacterium]
MIKKLLQIWIKILPLLAMMLIVVELVLTNSLATLGSRVATLDSQIVALEEENARFALEAASASAILTLEGKARTLGFVEPTPPLSLVVQDFPVAIQLR